MSVKTPDELSRELWRMAEMHKGYFWAVATREAAAMLRELAGLPALAPPGENAAPARPKLKSREAGEQAAESLPAAQQDRRRGFFLG